MKIESIAIYKMQLSFKHPLKVAIGMVTGADNVVLKLTTDTGVVGWGEASPVAYISGDTQRSNLVTAEYLAQIIMGKNPTAIAARMSEINAFTVGEPSIRSAFDMALHDISAKAAGMPLYQFLGGTNRKVRTGLTIGLQETVEDTLRHAKSALIAGFTDIKMKVGRQSLADVEHVQAVRNLAGPDIEIKIDSNQGWDYPTAVANIKAMEPLRLQYSEQPLPVWGPG